MGNIFYYLLPLFSGACDAASRLVIKTTKVNNFLLVALFALPFYAVWLYFEGIPTVHANFWFAVAAHVPLLALCLYLTVQAHRLSPLTQTMPYLSFTPAFLLITSPIMTDKTPTIYGMIGVLILTFGLYLLNCREGKMGIIDSFRNLKKEKGSQLMLLVAVIYSITANLDKIALDNANNSFYLLVDHGAVGIVMLLMPLIIRAKDENNKQLGLKDIFYPIGKFRALMIFSVLFAFSVIPHMIALSTLQIVPYVISLKRSGSILFAVAFGIIAAMIIKRKEFNNEIESLKYRLSGVLIMVMGMLTIIFYGLE